MARYKGWRTSFKDVQEINRLLVDAESAVSEAVSSIVDDYGFPREYVESLMPVVPDINAVNTESLHEEFATRADFERTKRYLGRIVKASESKPRKGYTPFSSEVENNLTSFKFDESGPIESAFMNSEQRLQIVNRNRRSIAELERLGVSMEQVNVYELRDEGYVPKRDDSGHIVKVWQPSTPRNQELYQDIVDSQSELAIVTPDNAVGGVVQRYGDLVDVSQRTTHRVSAERLYAMNLVDEYSMLRTENYFLNYQAIIETTLPEDIAIEMQSYVDGVLSLPPSEQYSIYQMLEDEGGGVGSIEYLYTDRSGVLPARIQGILTFWRTKVAPRADVEVMPDAPELGELTNMLESSGYAPNSAQNLMGEYHERRARGQGVLATFDTIRSSLGLVDVSQRSEYLAKRKKRKK